MATEKEEEKSDFFVFFQGFRYTWGKFYYALYYAT